MSSITEQVKVMDVANYFIHLSNQSKSTISNKKLQKLVYYAQVWSLVLNDEKLFSERIEAWVHGPAIPVVYKKFKGFEFNPIMIDTSKLAFVFTSKQKKLLDSIWSIYGKHTAGYLEALTHSELPWQEARKDVSASEASSNIISLKTAKQFYAGKLEESRKQK